MKIRVEQPRDHCLKLNGITQGVAPAHFSAQGSGK